MSYLMKTSPFKFGEVVTGKHFTNRDIEIKHLQNNFRSLQNTIIISPRRYGKSSLVKEAVERYSLKEKDTIFCFFDLMYVYTEEEFYNLFASTILKATSNKLDEFLQLVKNVIKGARVTINAGTGEPALELGVNYIKENTDAILNLAQTIARKKKKRIIICLDEFQNISRFKLTEQFQGRLRSSWQHHHEVGYLLYGSSQSMMMELFQETNSPFYRFGEFIYLNRIDSKWLTAYVKQAFQSTGKTISAELCQKLIDTIENHPYYLQQFARNLWLNSGKTATEANYKEARRSLISENLNFYNQLFDDLTHYQVNFLKALLNKEEHIYSSSTIQQYGLGSSANTRRMYKAFVNKGIIIEENGKLVFADPVFKLIAEERLLQES